MLFLDVSNQRYQFLKNNAILCRCNCAQCDNRPKWPSLDRVKRHMLTIKWVNLAMGSILMMSSNVKELFEIRLTTQQLSFLHSNILCKIMVNDLLNNQNILKDIFEEKRGLRQKWVRREKVEFLIDTTDFLSLNSEQWTGKWLLLRKWFGTFFTSKWIFSWMSVRWLLRLPDSENNLEHSLQGRGRRVFNLINLIWELRDFFQCEL